MAGLAEAHLWQLDPSCIWNLVACQLTNSELRSLVATQRSGSCIDPLQHVRRGLARASEVASLRDALAHLCYDAAEPVLAVAEKLMPKVVDALDVAAALIEDGPARRDIVEACLLIDVPMLCTASRHVLRAQPDGSIQNLGFVAAEPCVAAPLRRGLACCFPRQRYVVGVPPVLSVRTLHLCIAMDVCQELGDVAKLSLEAHVTRKVAQTFADRSALLHKGTGAAIVSLLARLPNLEELEIDCSKFYSVHDYTANGAARLFWEALSANTMFASQLKRLRILPSEQLQTEMRSIIDTRDATAWLRIGLAVGCMMRMRSCFQQLETFECCLCSLYEDAVHMFGAEPLPEFSPQLALY